MAQEERRQRQQQHQQHQLRRSEESGVSLSSSPSKSVDILVECASDLKFNNSSDKNVRGSEEAANIQNVVTNGCCRSNSDGESADHKLELLNCCRAYSAAESEYRFPVPHGHSARSSNKSCSIVGKLATALRKNIVHDSGHKTNTTTAANRLKTKITQLTESKHQRACVVDGAATVAVNEQLEVEGETEEEKHIDINEAEARALYGVGNAFSETSECDDLTFIDSSVGDFSSASRFVNKSLNSICSESGKQNEEIVLNCRPRIDNSVGDRVIPAAANSSRQQPISAKNVLRARCECGTVGTLPANNEKCAKCRKRIKELHSIANAYSETVSSVVRPSREFSSLESGTARSCPVIVKATFCDSYESETDCEPQQNDSNRRHIISTTSYLKDKEPNNWHKARTSHGNVS